MALGATAKARIRVLLIAIVTLGALGLFLWSRNRQSTVTPVTTINEGAPPASATPTPAISPTISPRVTSAVPSSADIPQAEPGLSPSQPDGDLALPPTFIGKLNLVIPVAGLKPEQLLDTFTEARLEGRSHDAIDIIAPAGTPVLAVSEGEIVRLFQSERGGITIYQLSPDKKLVFYYAHLQRYADEIATGKYVRQGEVIAYVGDTGNAGAGNYHLHFSITALTDPKRYWEGTNINPYPLLK